MTAAGGRQTADHNSMLYWYPKIKGKVPTPKTVFVPVHCFETSWLDGNIPASLILEVKRAANSLGYPAFMRTEQLSAKHEWSRTCFVESEAVIAQHLYNLIEAHYLTLDMQMDARPKAIILREFLHLRSFFTAYSGMPVAREFRMFATNGKIECIHPYWPRDAIREGRPSVKNWRSLATKLEADPPLEAFEIVKTASKEFTEQMSFDVCELEDGRWMLTDMATGADSFHYPHPEPKPTPTGAERRAET